MYDESYYRGSCDKDIGYSEYSASTASIKCYPPYGWELLLEETALANVRTLDVGCAFGKWVYWMAKAGAKATGIDVSLEGVAWGRDNLGLDLRQTSLEKLEEPEKLFDVITMIDLIEHIADLEGFINRLVLLLKPGGLLFVQTPNFGTYQTWGDRCIHLRYSLEHLLYFEPETLDNTFAGHGLLPNRQTRVLVTIPCDVDSYSKLRKAGSSSLKGLLKRLPGIGIVRLIRSKLCRRNHIYEYDDTGQKGATIIGCYRKGK